MADKFSNIKERIIELAKNEGFTMEIFFQKIGMSYGNFKGKSKLTPINSDAIANISTIIPNVNFEWLITGNGPMIKENAPPAPPNEDYNKLKDELIESQREVIRLQKEIAELKATKSHKHPAAGSMAGKLEKK